MKLRRSFSSQQLLFALAASLALAVSGVAQDKITTKDGRTQDVKIVGMSGSSVQVQVGAGSIGIPIASVQSVTMAAPAAFTAAKAAYDAKDYAKALAGLKPLVDKFKGLPTEWAQQATGLLGDIYVALNKLPDAEKAYTDYQKTYGGAGGSSQSEVGLARIALSKKDYSGAKQRLEPVTAKALGEKHPSAVDAPVYSQAFLLLAQVNEAENDYPAALQNYLRTVTLFYHDRSAASTAQGRADALRKEQKVAVP